MPTMGYLHEGHLSLIRKARKQCDFLIISIYVNPIQFRPGEDYNKYPRDLKRDKKLARDGKVDVIFAPTDNIMYPDNFQTKVNNEGSLSGKLCGIKRPGHFKGVCTVVTKLFNIVKADVAYFGQKDYQQASIIKQMVKDLNMDTKIKILPTVREDDGLAVSSRNKYLNSNEREKAAVLYQSLIKAKKLIKDGKKDTKHIKQIIRRTIRKAKGIRTDYCEIVDPVTLKNVKDINKKVLIALCIWIGKTRLIDNILIKP